MSHFSLLPDTFLVRRQNARLASTTEQRPIESDHGSRRVSLDSNVRQTQSFFPRMPASFSNVLQHLGLCSTPAKPQALSPTEQRNQKAYRLFRTVEKAIRMPTIREFQSSRISADRIEFRHRKFDTKLQHALTDLFPRILRDTQADYSGLSFGDALCNAYASTVVHTLRSLGPDFAVYTAAMKAPMAEIGRQLRSALAVQVTEPSQA